MSRRAVALVALAMTLIAAAGLLGWRMRRPVDARPSTDPAERLSLELRQTPFAEHQRVFARYLEPLGAAGSLDVVEKLHPFCHSQGHPLGMAIYDATHDLHESIEACSNRCTGGCFHGVLTAAVRAFAASSPDANGDRPVTFEQVVAHAKAICDDPKLAAVQRQGNCAHGIGHALTFLSGLRMPQAIEGCHAFATKPLQYYCASGAYMERDFARGGADVNATLAPCDAEAEFPAACYRYKMPHVFRSGKTLDEVAARCLALSGHQRLGCFHGIGFARLDSVARFPEALQVVCRFGTADDQQMCVEGAIEKLSEFDRVRAARACDALESGQRVACRRTLEGGMYAADKPMDRYVAAAK